MKKTQRIIIGVHTDAVRVLVVRSNSVVRSARVSVDNDGPTGAWEDGLRGYEDALAHALDEAGVSTPCEARVVYDSPTAAISAGPTPTPGKPGANAALLELETRGGADLSLQSHASWVLGSEPDGTGYAVAATDSPLTLGTLAQFCERSGVTMLSAAPSEAVGLSGALSMYARSPHGQSRVCAWFGTWCAGVVVANPSGVRFVRSSPLTFDALTNSIKGLRQLDEAAAVRLLNSVGVPGSRDAIEPVERLTQADMHDVRASLQPLLQRTAVDLRQSLRFGLGKDDMEQALIRAGGEASQIAGLIPLLAELLGVRHECDRSIDEHAHLVECLDRIRLQDDERAESRAAGRVKRAIWVGAAAALGVSVAQGLLAADEASREQASLQALRSGATSMESILAREEAVQRIETTVSRVERAAHRSAGFGPRWTGWLVDLAERRPERVVVLGMSGMRDKADAGVFTMTGAIVPEGAVEGGGLAGADEGSESQMSLLTSFIATLEESPLVETVELGPTRRGSALGEDATGFELTIALRAAPTLAEATDG
ncbi:MAG: hypothetical protein AAGH64_02640 [Planctomycetota bacterium]